MSSCQLSNKVQMTTRASVRGDDLITPLYVREGEPRPLHSSPTAILVFRWGGTWAIGPWAFTRAKIK